MAKSKCCVTSNLPIHRLLEQKANNTKIAKVDLIGFVPCWLCG
jgi:hypothetical protein